jgi:DNA-binding MarR family transcriptional regulator
MAATELAEATMLTSGAMTNRLDRLESDKLIRRLKDESDGRRVLVELTVWGLKLVETAAETRFQAAMEALDSLTSEQRESLSDLLRVLLTSLES